MNGVAARVELVPFPKLREMEFFKTHRRIHSLKIVCPRGGECLARCPRSSFRTPVNAKRKPRRSLDLRLRIFLFIAQGYDGVEARGFDGGEHSADYAYKS